MIEISKQINHFLKMYFQILILEIVKRAKVVDWPPLDCQLFAALRSCSQCCSVLGKKVDRRKEQPTVHGLPSVSGVQLVAFEWLIVHCQFVYKRPQFVVAQHTLNTPPSARLFSIINDTRKAPETCRPKCCSLSLSSLPLADLSA